MPKTSAVTIATSPREDEDAQVERERRRPHAARRERGERPHAPERAEEAEPAAGDGEKQALGEEQAHEARAGGAERDADRDLVPPRQRPREEKVRDVGAGDEEDEPDGGEEDEDLRARASDEVLAQRDEARAGLVGVAVLAEAAGERAELRLRLRGGDAGGEPRDDVEVVRAHVGDRIDRRAQGVLGDDEARRRPELAGLREAHALGDDADDGVRLPVEEDGSPDDAGVGVEAAAPGPLGEDDLTAAVDPRAEPAAEHRLEADDAEEIAGDDHAVDAHRPLVAGDVEGGVAVSGDSAQRGHAGSPLHDVRARGRVLLAGLDLLVVDRDQPIGVVEGQGPEEHRVHDAEDGGVGSDAERQRDDRDEREAGSLDEGAPGDPEVGEESGHGGDGCKRYSGVPTV